MPQFSLSGIDWIQSDLKNKSFSSSHSIKRKVLIQYKYMNS